MFGALAEMCGRWQTCMTMYSDVFVFMLLFSYVPNSPSLPFNCSISVTLSPSSVCPLIALCLYVSLSVLFAAHMAGAAWARASAAQARAVKPHRCVVRGVWCVVWCGEVCVCVCAACVVCGVWRVEQVARRMICGVWHVACCAGCGVFGAWCALCGAWCVERCVVCGAWRVVRDARRVLCGALDHVCIAGWRSGTLYLLCMHIVLSLLSVLCLPCMVCLFYVMDFKSVKGVLNAMYALLCM